MDFTKVAENIVSGNFTFAGIVVLVIVIFLFLKGKSVLVLIDKRKSRYPALLQTVGNIYAVRKIHRGHEEILRRNRKCLGEMRTWKREDHEKLFSNRSVKAYFALEEALARNPGGMPDDSCAYQPGQLDAIEKRRGAFVRALQKDTDAWYAFFMEMEKYADDARSFFKKRTE